MSDDSNRPFDGPERAVRAANRLHRRMRRRHGGLHGSPPAFFGVVFLAMGALFLLDNLGIADARSTWRTFWPLVLVGWGTLRLLSGEGGRFFPWLAVGAGSLLLGNRLFGWDLNVGRLFGPLVLIALGAHILYRSWRRPPALHAASAAPAGPSFAPGSDASGADIYEDSSATFRESVVMGSVERRNISQTFRGGNATVFIGSVEIDLRECRMASTEAVVDVSVVMGSVELRIPREWTVESRVSALLGSFEDRTDLPVEPSVKRFIVRGTALMGSVEIFN